MRAESKCKKTSDSKKDLFPNKSGKNKQTTAEADDSTSGDESELELIDILDS